MKRTIKTGLSLLMAASIFATGIPTMGATLKGADDKPSMETFKQDSTQKDFILSGKNKGKRNTYTEQYAEGEAIIMYYGDVVSSKSMKKQLGSDYSIEKTYDFSGVNSKKVSSLNNKSVKKGNKLSVSVVKSDDLSTEELIKKLSTKKNIISATPNYKKRITTTNDTFSDFQWALDNQGQEAGTPGLDINADSKSIKNNSESKEKVIAIIDTGVDYTHEDLKDVMWENPFNDNRLRGEHGYDFVSYDEEPMDDNGHGTHCTGIMSANMNNQLGIAGVTNSDDIKIMALKFLDEEGYGFDEGEIGALNYIYKAQQLGVNIVSINCSYGGYEPNEITETLMEMIGENGALFITAAGNDGCDKDGDFGEPSYPSSYESDYIVSVAASNEKDELADFSCFGEKSVDLAAPGTNILSTVAYDCFNPITYSDEQLADLTSLYYSFDDEKDFEQVINNDGYTPNNTPNTIKWGYTTDGNAKVNLSYADNEFFGPDHNNKSLKISVKDLGEGECVMVYFPYTIETSKQAVYSALSLKSFVENEETWGYVDIYDSELNEESENLIDNENAIYIGEKWIDSCANYWSFMNTKIADKVKKEQTRCIALEIYGDDSHEFSFYIDSLGVSKEEADSSKFGKYDWYNGTSMAAPHVTAAAAVISAMYPDKSNLEVKDILMGSTRECDTLNGKVFTSGVLDLSKVENPRSFVEDISISEDNIVVKGILLGDAKVKVEGKEVVPQQIDDNMIIIQMVEGYENKNINVDIDVNGNEIHKTVFNLVGKELNKVENTGFNFYNGDDLISAGDKVVYYDQYEEGGFYVGSVPEDKTEPISWDYRKHNLSADLLGFSGLEFCDIAWSRAIYAKGYLFMMISVDAHFSSKSAIFAYDMENDEIFMVTETPYFDFWDDTCLIDYNGELYFLYTRNEEGAERTIYKLDGKIDPEGCDVKLVETDDLGDIPEEVNIYGVYNVGDKLVAAYNYDWENDKLLPNWIFDGNEWKKSGTSLEISNLDESLSLSVIDGGLVYSGVCANGLGDIFIYDVENDTYKSAGYITNRKTLNEAGYNSLMATVVNDRFIAVAGKEYDGPMISFNFDEKCNTKRAKTNSLDEYDEDSFYENEEGDDELIPMLELNMPVAAFLDENYSEENVMDLPSDVTEKTTSTLSENNSKKTKDPKDITASNKKAKVKNTQIKSIIRKGDRKKAKIKLKKLKNVAGYQIKYSTSRKFAKKKSHITSSKSNVIKIKKLKTKKNYYVKARAYIKVNGKRKYGNWSNTKKM